MPQQQQQQQPSASSMHSGGVPEGVVVVVTTPRGGVSLLGSFTSKLGGMVGRRGAAAAEPSILSKVTYAG